MWYKMTSVDRVLLRSYLIGETVREVCLMLIEMVTIVAVAAAVDDKDVMKTLNLT